MIISKDLIFLALLILLCTAFAKAQNNNQDSIIIPDSAIGKINDFKIDSNSFDGVAKYKKYKANKDKAIKINGEISVEAQYATAPYIYQQYPQNYVRFHIAPKVSIFGIPFSTGFDLTTEQARVNYDINRFQFALDINQLSKNLKSKLVDRLENNLQDSLLNQSELKFWEDSMAALKTLDLDIDERKKLLKSSRNYLDSLEKEYPSFSGADTLQDVDLKNRKQYKLYQEKKAEYDKMHSYVDSVEQIRERAKDFEKAYGKWKNGGLQDPEKLLGDLKRNPNKHLPKQYMQHPFLSKAERLLLTVRDFKIGTINPTGTSSSYLGGTMLNGVAIENSFGNIYTSLQAGVLQQSLAFGSLQQKKPSNYLYAAKAGYGMPENTHIHASIIQAGKLFKNRDNGETSTNIPSSSSGRVLGLNGSWVYKNIRLDADWATSDNPTQVGGAISESSANAIATPLTFLNSPNSSYILAAKGSFFQELTTLNASTQYIGTNFRTPGNVFMRNDLKRVKIDGSQKIYKNFISLTLGYQHDEDNLLGQKRYTTEVETKKASVKIRFKKLPSLIVSYSNINQYTRAKENNAAQNYNNMVQVYTITSVYTKRIGTKSLTSSVTYMRQDMQNNFSSAKRKYNNITATSTLINNRGDNITFSSTAIISNTPFNSHVYDNKIEVGYNVPKIKTLMVYGGVNLTYDNNYGNSGGVFLRPQVSFWKNNKVILLLRQNFFKGSYINSKTYQQTIVNIQFIQLW